MTATERPRCGMCGKLIKPHTKIVHAPTEPKTHRPVADWQYQGNQQVVQREYNHYLVSPNRQEWVERYVQRSRGGDIYGRDYERIDRMDEELYVNWTYEKRLRRISVWDGESYLPKDGFFCSGPCAGMFARKAFEAGYRIKRKPTNPQPQPLKEAHHG